LEDFDLFQKLWRAYEEELAGRDSADYELNKAQFAKFRSICNVLSKAAKRGGGHIDPLRIAPAEKHCGVTVYAPLFYFANEEVGELCKSLQGVSGISIDCTLDEEACISVVVPNVFRKK